MNGIIRLCPIALLINVFNLDAALIVARAKGLSPPPVLTLKLW